MITNKLMMHFNISSMATDDMRRLAVEDSGDLIVVFERKGMKPLCALQLVAA